MGPFWAENMGPFWGENMGGVKTRVHAPACWVKIWVHFAVKTIVRVNLGVKHVLIR